MIDPLPEQQQRLDPIPSIPETPEETTEGVSTLNGSHNNCNVESSISLPAAKTNNNSVSKGPTTLTGGNSGKQVSILSPESLSSWSKEDALTIHPSSREEDDDEDDDSCDKNNHDVNESFDNVSISVERDGRFERKEGNRHHPKHPASNKSSSTVWGPLEADLQEAVSRKLQGLNLVNSEAAAVLLKVTRLCFCSLAVVFRESTLAGSKSSFSYTRIPNIPSIAVRLLWAELLGGVKSVRSNEETKEYRLVVRNQTSSTDISTLDPTLTVEERDMFLEVLNHDPSCPDASSSFNAFTPLSPLAIFSLFQGTPPPQKRLSLPPSSPLILPSTPSGRLSMQELYDHDSTNQTNTFVGGKEQLFISVRNILVDAGFLEIAGRRVDDEDDDNSSETTRDAEDDDGDDSEAESTDASEEDEDGHDDVAMDFSAWSEPRLKKRSRRRRPKRTQYLQIYKDMHVLYGLHLASLALVDGGFALLGDTTSDVEVSPPSSLEVETMKRWDQLMAQACQGQLQSSNVVSKGAEEEGDDKKLPSVAGASGEVSKSSNDFSTSAQSESVVNPKKKEERWMRSHSENPFDEGASYALRMYPSHLMRCGRVKEAASILSHPQFFLARICAWGPFEAARHQTYNIDELKRRCDLAIQGNALLGGDGDCLDPDEVALIITGSMIDVLKERFRIPVSEGEVQKKHKLKGERGDGDVGRAFHSIASMLVKMKEYKRAGECFEKALEYKSAVLGAEHRSVARTYRHFAHLQLTQQEHDTAIESYSEALRIERYQDDVGHGKIIVSLNSIAAIHGMKEDYRKAIDLYSESLVIQRVHLGESHVQVAETLNSLGVIYSMMGSYEKAVECLEEAVAIKTSHGLDKSDEVAVIQFNLGLVHYKRGDHGAAIHAYQKALRIRHSSKKEERGEVARLLYHMGVVLGDGHKYDESARCYEESLRIRRRILGDDHEDVARTLHNLGLIYFLNSENKRSLACFSGALSFGRKEFGRSEKVADTLHSMGLVYQQDSNFKKAIESYTEAVSIRREILGNSSVQLASTLHNMGDVRYMMGEMEPAMDCYHEACKIRVESLGEGDVEVAATRNNMGVVYMKRSENEQAMECFKAALEIRQQKLGLDHEKCSDTLHNMGLVYKNLKQYDEAILHYEQALRIRQRQLGRNDAKVADTLYNMAIVYTNTQNYESALQRYQEALRTYRFTGLTDKHPSVVNTLQWIKWTEKKLNETKRTPNAVVKTFEQAQT